MSSAQLLVMCSIIKIKFVEVGVDEEKACVKSNIPSLVVATTVVSRI